MCFSTANGGELQYSMTVLNIAGLEGFKETDGVCRPFPPQHSVEDSKLNDPLCEKLEISEDVQQQQTSGKATPEREPSDLSTAPETGSPRPVLFSTQSLDAHQSELEAGEEPFRQRLRTISGGMSPVKLK